MLGNPLPLPKFWTVENKESCVKKVSKRDTLASLTKANLYA